MEVAELIRNDTASNRFDGMTLPRLMAAKESAQAELSAAKSLCDMVDTAIRARVAEAVETARHDFDKHEGAIHVVVDGCDVKSTVPKIVAWNTDALDSAAAGLTAIGHQAADWIDFKLSVSERKYSSAPHEVREILDRARTLKHGAEKIDVIVP